MNKIKRQKWIKGKVDLGIWQNRKKIYYSSHKETILTIATTFWVKIITQIQEPIESWHLHINGKWFKIIRRVFNVQASVGTKIYIAFHGFYKISVRQCL
jgi:hypothetical protein